MWYREILAYREVTDKEGEITYHRTKSKYDRPSFLMDENAKASEQMVSGGGNNALTQGPGLYTSQNPAEMHHYNFLPKTRQVRMPKGARVLDWENLTEEDVKIILDGWNEKYNTNYQYNPSLKDMDDILHLITNSELPIKQFKINHHKFKWDIPGNPLLKLYPLLIKLGFDAIDYYDYTGRNKDNTKYLNSWEHQNLSRRTRNKKDKNIDKKNILILNRSMITRPDLFQKARFRPETLTEEEKKIIDDENETTNTEYGIDVLNSGALPDLKLDSIVQFLENGADPMRVLEAIKKINFYFMDTNDKFEFLRKIKKYYNENIIFVIFNSKEIKADERKIREILGDYDTGQAVGFAINSREAIEEYLEKLTKRYFPYEYIDEDLNLNETVDALKQYQRLSVFAKIDEDLVNLVSARIPQLFEHYKKLIQQINSFDTIYKLVNDTELRSFLPMSVNGALVWKQNELRMQNGVDLLAQRHAEEEKLQKQQTEKLIQSPEFAQQSHQKVAYKVRIRYVV